MRWMVPGIPLPVAGLVAGLAGVALMTWLIDVVGDDVNELSLTVCFQLLVLVVSGLSGAVAGPGHGARVGAGGRTGSSSRRSTP